MQTLRIKPDTGSCRLQASRRFCPKGRFLSRLDPRIVVTSENVLPRSGRLLYNYLTTDYLVLQGLFWPEGKISLRDADWPEI